MELSFTNGTTAQKTGWERALSVLLGLPTSAFPLKVVVTFVDPGTLIGHGHTDLADTTWTYGSTESTTEVRNDAPGFGDQQKPLRAEAASAGLAYNPDRFYAECAAHELGHSLFAALPQEARIAIAQLFGAKSDDIVELAPPGSAWQDRIIEGIAETFKDAFLPRRYRVFPNRTRHSIAYSKFPEFRRLFRDAIPEVEESGELEPGEEEVPGYKLDLFATGEPLAAAGEGSFPHYLVAANGKHGLWSTAYNDKPITAGHDSDLFAHSLFEGWIKDGTILSYSFLVPTSIFIDPPYNSGEILSPYHDFGVSWRLLKKTSPSGELTLVRNASWGKTIAPAEYVEAFGGEKVGEYALGGAAKGGGAPPVVFADSLTVNAANFPVTRLCKGVTYRYVGLQAQADTILTVQHPSDPTEHEKIRQLVLYPRIPSLNFSQPACTSGTGEKGQAIELPSGLIVPAGSVAGSKPHRRPIVGNLGG